MQQLIPGAHWEVRRGTHAQAKEYCSKPETRIEGPFEWGIPPTEQGKRNDVLAFKAAVDGGQSDEWLWDNLPGEYLHYARMVPSLRELKGGVREWKTQVHFLYGPPGVGKSYYAKERCGGDAYWKSPNNNWWDGYHGQTDVVLDDYKTWLPWSELLQLLDENPCRLQVKGGHTQMLARNIWITTNFKPKEWYPNKAEWGYEKFPLSALLRRIDEWVVFLPGTTFPENRRDVEICIYTTYAEGEAYLG